MFAILFIKMFKLLIFNKNLKKLIYLKLTHHTTISKKKINTYFKLKIKITLIH